MKKLLVPLVVTALGLLTLPVDARSGGGAAVGVGARAGSAIAGGGGGFGHGGRFGHRRNCNGNQPIIIDGGGYPSSYPSYSGGNGSGWNGYMGPYGYPFDNPAWWDARFHHPYQPKFVIVP